jgi:predicted Zn-dependent peptidase
MKSNLLRVLALAALAASPAIAEAQTAPPTRYETFTLDNGLRFIVHEDHSTPIVAVDVWYDVGSANEAVRRSGFAHLFEHMLFQETENLPKGAFDTYLEEAGGQLNGTTNQDRTMYYEIVPSNRVNLALWLEAERMARLKVTKENFEREREVVKEERRMRIDNAPYGNGFLMLDTLHTDYQPYRHTVIGTMDDLNAATAQDVIDFYRQYYVPNNATIVLAGDITVEQARKFANEYFASIKTGKRVAPLPAATAAPRTDGERRQTLEDKLASVPLIFGATTFPSTSTMTSMRCSCWARCSARANRAGCSSGWSNRKKPPRSRAAASPAATWAATSLSRHSRYRVWKSPRSKACCGKRSRRSKRRASRRTS